MKKQSRFTYMPADRKEDSRKWALANQACPLEEFGEEKMCWDCPDDCPISDEENEEEIVSEGRSRAYRRHKDYAKALRKQKIAKAIYASGADENWEYYQHLHAYSKNKIHCSCPMCSAKTNAKGNKSHGRVDEIEYEHNGKKYTSVRGSRMATTNHRNGKRNYKHSEQQKVNAMNNQLYEEYQMEAIKDENS